MSTGLKVLEGVTEVPVDLDYEFSYPTMTNVSVIIGQEDVVFGSIISVVPSVFSGPRCSISTKLLWQIKYATSRRGERLINET